MQDDDDYKNNIKNGEIKFVNEQWERKMRVWTVTEWTDDSRNVWIGLE